MNGAPPDAAQIAAMVAAAQQFADETVARNDPGYPFEAAQLDILCMVKLHAPADFERIRAQLKQTGVVRVTALDLQVAEQLGEGLDDGERIVEPAHWAVEPSPQPVDGEALADELVEVLTRHIKLPAHAPEAIALWILHAWCIDAASHSPLLAFLSPVRRCGKSSALILLLWLCPRSEPASSITASVIFRFIEVCCPTLLIDELDNAIDGNKDLLAILNAGHNRAMAYVLRSVGNGADFQPGRFSAWAPKALGTINTLPSTLADRSIIIPMSRKRPSDNVERVLSTDSEELARLRSQCLRWSEDHKAELATADPRLPEQLDDRAMDNWRPIKAIADALGHDWSERCWNAAIRLSADRTEEETTGVALLAALKVIFAEHAKEILNRQGQPDGKAMHTGAILTQLQAADARWEEFGRGGKPITDRGLARLLSAFRIKPSPISINGTQKRGYRVGDFEDAFSRYI